MSSSSEHAHSQLNPTWNRAVRAISYLESLGFDVTLTPRDTRLQAEWDEIQAPDSQERPPLDEDAALALGLLKEKAPQPVEVKVALSRRIGHGQTGRGKAPFLEMVARFLAANWRKDWCGAEVWPHIKDKMSTKNKNPSGEIAKSMKRLHRIGFLHRVRQGRGTLQGRFQLNKDYDPNHPDLHFLKNECPNGFRDIQPDYQKEGI